MLNNSNFILNLYFNLWVGTAMWEDTSTAAVYIQWKYDWSGKGVQTTGNIWSEQFKFYFYFCILIYEFVLMCEDTSTVVVHV